MLETYDSTWIALFQKLPDPRHRRGCRFPWWVLLTLVMAALVSNQHHPKAMSEWVQEHADSLLPVWPRMPSESTLRRALRLMDVGELEGRLRQRAETQIKPSPPGLQARALDGKTIRGAGKHGHRIQVVEEVVHTSGQVMWQQAVATKSNEIPLVQRMLAHRSLDGLLFTMDALHTQVQTAHLILEQGGQYLMVVKKNQPHLYRTLAEWFVEEAWPEEQREVIRPCELGHGRHEHRTLERRSTLHLLPLWPGMQQAMRRVTERWNRKTGAYQRATVYALTSVPLALASAGDLEGFWRGHWGIENQVHYVRDRAFQEDACQVARGNAPLALAALRNGVLNHLRLAGNTNMAAALRRVGAHVSRALEFVGLRL